MTNLGSILSNNPTNIYGDKKQLYIDAQPIPTWDCLCCIRDKFST